jgi:hypothetical protein
MTLVEVMVSAALASIVLAGSGSLYVFGSRSFTSMSNYTDMDVRSREAVDLMSRDIRDATAVTAYTSTSTNKVLAVTNALAGTAAIYTWNSSQGTMVCSKTGQADQIYLKGCDSWDFQLYQRSPQSSGSYVFYPATNTTGAYDLTLCKLINMSWKCSRTIIGSKLNTESVQTAQVVLRNKQ